MIMHIAFLATLIINFFIVRCNSFLNVRFLFCSYKYYSHVVELIPKVISTNSSQSWNRASPYEMVIVDSNSDGFGNGLINCFGELQE